MRARVLFEIAIAAALLTLAEYAWAQSRPAGDDFQINAYTPSEQRIGPAGVAMNETTGDFVLVWASFGQDGDGEGVFAKRYDRYATPQGTEFQVNTTTSGNQGSLPFSGMQLDVAMRDDGSFLVVWASAPVLGTSDVFARLYDSAGVATGPEILVNTYTSSNQERARVDYDAAGNFVVVWESDGQDGSASGIVGRRLDATGAPVGAEFQINTYTTSFQIRPDVAVVPDGSFVVSWSSQSATDPDDDSDVIVRRFAADATALSTEQVVPNVNDRVEVGLHIDNDATGRFLVSWLRSSTELTENGYFLRRLDFAGTPIGTDLPAGNAVAMEPDGEYVVADLWTSPGQEFLGQRFDTADQPLGPVFPLRSDLANLNFSFPSIDIDMNGNFVVAWDRDEKPQGGSGALDFEVAARRFCDPSDPTCDVCPGYDDTVDSDGDGTPDGCDPCTALSAAQQFTRINASVRYGGFDDLKDIPLKLNRVRMKGDLALPGLFAGFDPVADGARVRVESMSGGKVADFVLPGGSYSGGGTRGWRLNGTGTVWTYIDSTTDRINGFSKMSVKDRSNSAPGAVRVVVKAGGGIYGTDASFLPLTAIVLLGDQAAADSGQCGLASFDLAECDAHIPFGNMRCRR